MKKKLTLFLLPLLFLIASCKKTENVVTPNRTVLVDVKAGEWTSENGGKTFSANIQMPEITTDFNNYGGVLVYISFDNQVYEQIPQVYNGITYSYTMEPGNIDIDIQSALGDEVISPPGQKIKVKVVLIDSI
ncbi:MAG: hypothetical protein ACOH2A_15560 [Sphingobacteriaceae bacterium]